MNQVPPHAPQSDLARGWHWFVDALVMLRRWPTIFVPMGLIIAVIHSLVPVLGSLATLIWGPALLAGIVLAAHAATTRQTPQVGLLFGLFRNGRLGEATKLCLPLVAGKIVAAIVLSIGLVLQLKQQGIDPATLEDQRKLMSVLLEQIRSPAMHPWWAVAILIVLFSWTIAALAIPRVALTSSPALAAMARGFGLVWHHIMAWIVAIVALFAALTILTGLLLLTRLGILVELGVLTALYAVLGPLLYVAWRDLEGTAAALDATSPPPNAPPPASYLQA